MSTNRAAAPRGTSNLQLALRIIPVLVLAGAITALALNRPGPAEPVATVAPPAASPTPTPIRAAAPNALSTLADTRTPSTASSSAAQTSAAFDPAQSAVPTIPNPGPWQYDPATNMHFDPGHGHWHSGPPPSEQQRAAPTVTNPQPWEYDPVTNKHWNPLPGHNHWHIGPPPPADQRGG